MFELFLQFQIILLSEQTFCWFLRYNPIFNFFLSPPFIGFLRIKSFIKVYLDTSCSTRTFQRVWLLWCLGSASGSSPRQFQQELPWGWHLYSLYLLNMQTVRSLYLLSHISRWCFILKYQSFWNQGTTLNYHKIYFAMIVKVNFNLGNLQLQLWR